MNGNFMLAVLYQANDHLIPSSLCADAWYCDLLRIYLAYLSTSTWLRDHEQDMFPGIFLMINGARWFGLSTVQIRIAHNISTITSAEESTHSRNILIALDQRLKCWIVIQWSWSLNPYLINAIYRSKLFNKKSTIQAQDKKVRQFMANLSGLDK